MEVKQMKVDKDTLRDNFELLARALSADISEISDFIDIIYVSREDQIAAKKAIKILNSKLDDMKKCRSLKEAKKVVKMKKLADYKSSSGGNDDEG